MEVLAKFGPFTMVDPIVLEAWTPPHTIGGSDRGIVSGEGAFHLTETETGTRSVCRRRPSFPSYLCGRPTAMVARPVLERIWRSNFSMFAATQDDRPLRSGS